MPKNAPVAIVTGASRGLGLALARELAARGYRLVIDARGADALERARAELAERTTVDALPGDVTDPRHREALAAAAGDRVDVLVNNASLLGPSPQPPLHTYPLAELERVYAVNVTSDAAVEAYEGWGGYGSSKAMVEQLTRILAVEHPDLHVYAFDPGDMNTAMHQAAFPGEDISDRPPPEDSVPPLLELLEGDLPSGRYRAADLVVPS